LFNLIYLKQSLIFKIGLLFLFILSIDYSYASSSISLKENQLLCNDFKYQIPLKNNQELKISNKDSRIIELIEHNNESSDIKSYVFYTTDISKVVAYSGKPLEMLIKLNQKGIIEDIKLTKHSEPILLTGIPIEKLLEAVSFYKGRNINENIAIGEGLLGKIGIPIIAGATVTSLMLHETILESSREVGMIFNFITSSILDGALNKNFKKYSWEELLKIGAIKNYKLNLNLDEEISSDDNYLVDIYFADISHPSIGINLLGLSGYKDIVDDIGNKNSAIIILNNGSWSIKGSGFARGGIFDRFRIEQNGNIFTFRDNDLKNVYDLDIIDIDEFREAGIFIISNNKYKAWKDWDLVLLLNYKSFYINYSMPDIFCVSNKYPWLDQWKLKHLNIKYLLFLWVIVIIIFIFRDIISKNSFNLSVIYNAIIVFDIYLIGFVIGGQPSVVNIFAIKELKMFLWNPYLVIGWVMLLITTFIWGKALFCGWICPFGSLQELMFRLRSIIINNDKSIDLSREMSDKLRYLRYIIFICLILSAIIFGTNVALKLSEIEPFKTIWNVGILNREWYISLYTFILVFVSIFTYRFFCRFICPLGAFLSILSYFSILKLKRRKTCNICKICETKCNSRAINKDGTIDSKECFGCFTCVNNMYNKKLCPPLLNKKIWDKYEVN
jgi:NosR/NirI family transcriptional regulator, nitrous oxide reductase regulator